MFVIFKKIGEYGPLILFVLSIFLLRNKYTFLFYYVVFFGISLLLNLVLKGILQQPRPSIDEKTFQLMMKNKERYVTKHGMPYDIFGMPSGHSQSVVFSTIFIYFCLHDIKILAIYILISLITLFQRVINTHHTIMQVVVGSTIGFILGYIGYIMAKLQISGKKTAKKDDFGPI
jgi:membrane-associated phospholipid phosphatase